MLALLRLDLRSALRYAPDSEAPYPAELHWPLPPLAEGEEELYLFGEAETISPPGESGPVIASSPRARRFLRPAIAGATPAGAGGCELAAGLYAFAQFEAGEPAAVVAAMEDFVKECWWQRLPVAGPLCLRRVGEDGAARLQLWRSIPDS